MGCKGKGPTSKRQKGLPVGPPQDTRMLSLFQRKRPPVAGAPPPAPATVLPKGLMRPESAASLLATPREADAACHLRQESTRA